MSKNDIKNDAGKNVHMVVLGLCQIYKLGS
jgi:hypothetical protein